MPPSDPQSPVLDRLNAALVGRYRIVRELGEGGMATVYLAEDLKHDRKVAVKVLRPELAAVVGAERFLAEIKTTANLQHPHILPLHDSGEADSFLFYVMPYVQGESLREKLEREKQLRVTEAVELTRKVADALDYAHDQGVVHRDIKPANILLSERGEPLVADFGIALAVTQAGAGRITETGLSLGTPHYMSPEQATGDRDVDPRSDVYALGCVLYEMLAGQPPFAAPTAQAVLARILTEDARRVTELRRTVPAHVAAVLEKALEKLPADRFENAAELREALTDESFTYESTRSAPVPAASVTVAPPEPRDSRRGLWLAAAATVLLLAALAGWGWLRPEPPGKVVRFAVIIDSAGSEFGPTAVLSPDGSRIVYVGSDGQLWTRPLRSLESRPIPETSGARAPFFSPDGDGVGYHQNTSGSSDGLATVSLSGAPPVQLVSGPTIFPGSAWSDDGYVYYPDADGNLFRVRARGGPVEPVIDSTSGYAVGWPDALPGGEAILVTSWPSSSSQGDTEGVAVVTPSTGEVTPILTGLTGSQTPGIARYAAGHLFWATADMTLMAAPFDVAALELTGPPVALASGVLPAGFRSADFDVAEDGTLLYSLGFGSGLAGLGENMVWLSRSGDRTVIDPRLAQDVGDFDYLSLSPDGRYIAAEVQSGPDNAPAEEHHVWLYDLDQATFVRLTLDGTMNTQPRWLDERTVVFLSWQDGSNALLVQGIEEREARELLRLDRPILHYDVQGPTDPIALTVAGEGDTQSDIVWARPGDSTARGTIAATRFVEIGAEISPDGRWVAYTSEESGRPEVYVSPFPAGGRGRAISTTGGSHSRWTADGGELLYAGIDGQLMVAELETETGVVVRGRSSLFRLTPFEQGLQGFASYDVTPDGRLLMVAEASGGGVGRRIIVLNVFEELDDGA